MSGHKSRGRLWFAIHGWAALPIWLFLFFVCVTGTLATVDREILWLFNPDVRAVNPDQAAAMPLNQLVAEVERQIPGAHVNSLRFEAPYLAVETSVSTADAPNATVWVNPFSGLVQGISHGMTFPNFLRALHGWLLMPWHGGTALGWYAVTALSVPLLASLITGLVVYKRFWQAFIRPKLRLAKGSRVAWGDFHRLAGTWSLWFITVISLTGLWFLVVGVLYDSHMLTEQEAPDINRRDLPKLALGDSLPVIDLDGAVAMVKAIRPDSRLMVLELPESAYGPITLYSRSSFRLLAEQAWINPYQGELIAIRDAGVVPWLQVMEVLAASLHYGNFAGLPVKLIWFVFGLLLCGLVLSGMVTWTKRTIAAGKPADQPRPRRLWRHGKFYLSGLLLVFPLIAFPAYFKDTGSPPLGQHILPERSAGPWRLTLAEARSGAPYVGPEHHLLKDYVVQFHGGYPDRIRAAFLQVGRPLGMRDLGNVLEGNPYRLRTEVRFYTPPQPDEELWLTVEEWDGTLHQLSWPLAEVITGPGAWDSASAGRQLVKR